MSDSFNDDLLSAYFDDEASPEERADVERQLKSSEATENELGELRSLSKLMHELPHQSVLDEFRAAVMQEAERTTLLGTTSQVAMVGGEHKSRRRWMYAAGSLLVTTAALVVMVKLFDSLDSPSHTGETHLAATSPQANQDELGTADRVSGEFEQNKRVGFGGGLGDMADEERRDAAGSVTFGKPADRPAFAGAAVVTSKLPATALSRNAVSADARSNSLFSNSEVMPAARLKSALSRESNIAVNFFDSTPLNFTFADRKLNEAEVGQVVEVLETSGDQIVVVQLTVVDRQAGLESLQLLLARNQISVEPVTEKEKADADAESKKSKDSSDLIAVYVEASNEQLSAALRELNDEGPFQELVLDRTIAVAGLNRNETERLGSTFQLSELTIKTETAKEAVTVNRHRAKPKSQSSPPKATKRRSIAKKSAATQSPALKVAKNLTDKKQLSSRSQKIQTESVRGTNDRYDAVRQLSRQMQLSVPAKLLASAPKRDLAEKQQGAAKAKSIRKAFTKPLKNAPPAPVADLRKKNEGKVTKPRSLQVLFVLVTENPAKNAPTKATKPAPKAKPPRRKPNEGAA